MAVIIIVFAYLGNYLDHKWLTKTPYWTAGLLLLGVIISFVVVFRALKKMNNES
jgi:F0F1-type ATP synthase assembly protein I